jgi:hypothetical protein
MATLILLLSMTKASDGLALIFGRLFVTQDVTAPIARRNHDAP